ncbi:uncharacterized protein LOC111269155 [Varroa jacobsoni]|uniref:uncharacterized protein LOC111269155 n=1 Tax=Varroa jacobsoni TaxID=62625 RepID=UPI000BF7D630|nr:uncharacterized protein LOC111269155 [Varroa jacobsoni]
MRILPFPKLTQHRPLSRRVFFTGVLSICCSHCKSPGCTSCGRVVVERQLRGASQRLTSTHLFFSSWPKGMLDKRFRFASVVRRKVLVHTVKQKKHIRNQVIFFVRKSIEKFARATVIICRGNKVHPSTDDSTCRENQERSFLKRTDKRIQEPSSIRVDRCRLGRNWECWLMLRSFLPPSSPFLPRSFSFFKLDERVYRVVHAYLLACLARR